MLRLFLGEIPDLYSDDEVENIISNVRNEVKSQGLVDNRENCWKFFIERVRRQLKVRGSAAQGAEDKRWLPGASVDMLDSAVLIGHLGSGGMGMQFPLIPSTCVRMPFSPAASQHSFLLNNFRLECNCFPMLVPAVQWSEPTVCIHIPLPSWASLPLHPPSQPSIITEHRAELPVLDSSFLQLSVLCMVWICISATLPFCRLLSFPCWLHVSILYVCISLPAQHTGSSVPFF